MKVRAGGAHVDLSEVEQIKGKRNEARSDASEHTQTQTHAHGSYTIIRYVWCGVRSFSWVNFVQGGKQKSV